MKTHIKALIAILIIGVALPVRMLSHGDIKFHLELAMQMGDAKGVAATMEHRQDIILEYKDVKEKKTKVQLEKVMEVFFKENKPKSYTITHQGNYKDGTRHMEGTYTSVTGKQFQVDFEAQYDEVDAHHHLSLMRIEAIAAE